MFKQKFIKIYGLLAFVLVLLSACNTSPKYRALIVTGQTSKSHNWQASSDAMQKILNNSGIFGADLAISPETGADMSGFLPDFTAYDVVILDYDGDDWSSAMQASFESYVENGGGVVVVHASNNSFPKWKAYNLITGLGGWKGRNEESGPYLSWKNGKAVKDYTPGIGGMHGEKGMFVMNTRAPEHPIMKGLPLDMMHNTDEVYGKLRGPAENIEVLATSFSDPKVRGSNNHEPVLFTIMYKKGRIFHSTLGHVGKDGDLTAYKSAYFIYTLQRGAEWAATGAVTQVLPEDMPNSNTPLTLSSYKTYSLDVLFERAETYEVGKSKKYLNLINQRLRNAHGNPEVFAEYERRMLQLLESEKATADAKNFICKELSWLGTAKSIPVLEKLIAVEPCSEMARYALSRLTNN